MNTTIDNTRLKALMSEARAAHAREFRSDLAPAQRFARLRDEFIRVWSEDVDGERSAVVAIEARWQDITNAAFARAKEFPALLARLSLNHEPAAMATTLLRPMGKDLDERSHTRMLGALLDSSQNAQLATRLLRAMLEVVQSTNPCALHDDALSAATIKIEPEWRAGNKLLYPDLVILIPASPQRRLIVIENKIRAIDHEGQLDNYAECALREDADALLIYLTPKGTDPVLAVDSERWTRLSYMKLATAWRRELARYEESSAWVELLRLYLASVLQDVLGERLPHVPSRAAQLRLVDYLHAALGEPS